jgi:hypothetical protein
MKRILHSALPVIFRAASKVFHFALPTRKHYKAATDYETVPTPHTMNPLPSFVDLPSQGSLTSALPPAVRLHKRARQTSTESTASNVSIVSQESIEGIKRRPMEAKKHYDVDGKSALYLDHCDRAENTLGHVVSSHQSRRILRYPDHRHRSCPSGLCDIGESNRTCSLTEIRWHSYTIFIYNTLYDQKHHMSESKNVKNRRKLERRGWAIMQNGEIRIVVVVYGTTSRRSEASEDEVVHVAVGIAHEGGYEDAHEDERESVVGLVHVGFQYRSPDFSTTIVELDPPRYSSCGDTIAVPRSVEVGAAVEMMVKVDVGEPRSVELLDLPYARPSDELDGLPRRWTSMMGR